MPKKINSNKKGNAREHEVVKDLIKRFGKGFSRTIASGASATNMYNHYSKSKEADIKKNTGDIITPDNFKFVIEAKHYKEFDFFSFWPGESLIDKWFNQVKLDAHRIDKRPLLLFKFNYKKKMGCIEYSFKNNLVEKKVKFVTINENYIICTQTDLFRLHDNFFYEN